MVLCSCYQLTYGLINMLLAYCDNRSNLSHPWIQEGLSPCFFSTLSSSMLAAVAVICGGVQIHVYRRYAVRMESLTRWQTSRLERLYKLQLVLLALACIEPIVRLVSQLILVRHGNIYGYANASFYALSSADVHIYN